LLLTTFGRGTVFKNRTAGWKIEIAPGVFIHSGLSGSTSSELAVPRIQGTHSGFEGWVNAVRTEFNFDLGWSNDVLGAKLRGRRYDLMTNPKVISFDEGQVDLNYIMDRARVPIKEMLSHDFGMDLIQAAIGRYACVLPNLSNADLDSDDEWDDSSTTTSLNIGPERITIKREP
jgi:hypothetical protein